MKDTLNFLAFTFLGMAVILVALKPSSAQAIEDTYARLGIFVGADHIPDNQVPHRRLIFEENRDFVFHCIDSGPADFMGTTTCSVELKPDSDLWELLHKHGK